jgi:hypothetical protein
MTVGNRVNTTRCPSSWVGGGSSRCGRPRWMAQESSLSRRDCEGSRASDGAAKVRWPGDDLGEITHHRVPRGGRGHRDRVDEGAGWNGRSTTDSTPACGSRSPASHHVGAAGKWSRRPVQLARAKKQCGVKGTTSQGGRSEVFRSRLPPDGGLDEVLEEVGLVCLHARSRCGASTL